ncbi:MAG: tetratricopeptide repeat protein, partial [Luteolibacter sp.]
MSKQPTSRTALALMAAAAASPTLSSQAVANDAAESASSYSNLAQREMIRRERDVKEGEKLLLEGREAYAKGDYQQAVDQFSQALQLVPDAPLFQDRRQAITNHLSDASIALSIQHRKVGKFPEARTLLDNILTVDPDNALAKRELSYLDDPIRTNPGLDYEHTQNVDAVRRALYTAEGHYNLGKYDDAIKEYEKALRIDPYNSAARRGMERVEAAKSDYLRAAYDQTRATLLREVDAAWELTVPEDAPDLPIGQNRENEIGSGVARITEKLRTIIIPSLNFEDTTVEEAIDFLRLRSRELDTLELDPARKGVNFVIRRSRPSATSSVDSGLDAGAVDDGLPTLGADPSTLRIDELRVTNVPLEVALKYICDATRLRYKVDDFSVTLVPQTEEVDDVFTRTFTVPPDFASSLDSGGGAA